MDTERRIVVGVNGSVSAKAALRWAVEQAELTGTAVHAVIAWEFPAFYALVCSWEGQPVPPEEFEENARLNLDRTVDLVECETATEVEIRREVRCGHPTQVLLEAAESAALLVLGNRGYNFFYEALLGSVSRRCAVHARCPVVVVPEWIPAPRERFLPMRVRVKSDR
ncbi:universal stress protein [Saccharopolyspora pogona]|uniref:universal stress protein n=1 Tax=Saccharopolyspora pogona TaxID=333966 RepID=UPI00168541ED|nr:universal stress protein [Saccharopolyspora pogona]